MQYYEILNDLTNHTYKLLIDSGVEQSIANNVYDFLENCTSNKVALWEPVIAKNAMGVKWDMTTVTLLVLFAADDRWSWQLTAKDGEDGFDTYDVNMAYAGGSTFVVGGTHHFVLPDKVEQFITLPDTFDQSYEPMIPKHKVDLFWVTNKYDGMLSGYVHHHNKLHYATCVDETHFTRDRMFALYELSIIERIGVWIRYFKWQHTVHNRVLWSIYITKYRWTNKVFGSTPQYEKIKKFRATFEKNHKIVGYYAN